MMQGLKDRIVGRGSETRVKARQGMKVTLIFHPSRDMSEEELRRRINSLGLLDFEIYIEPPQEKSSLVSPFGVFSGKEKIEDGLNALKWLK